jgi:hypothetical protein
MNNQFNLFAYKTKGKSILIIYAYQVKININISSIITTHQNKEMNNFIKPLIKDKIYHLWKIIKNNYTIIIIHKYWAATIKFRTIIKIN